MSTLEDSFLVDLEELSDNVVGNQEEDIDMDMSDLETLNYDDLDYVSKSQRYSDTMHKVDSGYNLILDCNQLLVDIDYEICIVHNFIRDKYRRKFQELESIVLNAIEYATVVKQIGNEMDLSLVDLKSLLLPTATITAVSLTAVTTSLPEDVLRKAIQACDRVLDLDTTKKKVLGFLEAKMGSIAPNLSAIVGSGVAAKLIGNAGGLSELAKLPACNVQLLGQKKKNLLGFSSATSQSRVGYLEQSEIFQTTPPSLRLRVIKLLAGKSTLAARVDASGGDPSGTNGIALKEEILIKIKKWQEPFPARQPKPLQVPDLEPKKRRGGRRLRKTKERYAVTEMRKQANRMAFGVAEESSLGDGLGQGYGMLGHAKSNRLRVTSVTSKLKLNAKVVKKLQERQYASSGATTCGLLSSLAFTHGQGIELVNPRLASGTQSIYFSEFSNIKKI
ncbi:hypothetical protein AALP_AA1G172100 [Arabis alpina]|uniref:Nop domain-containing protein n=1 Tax=Arabis alpina TaxID=50452 RepID=A0A087HNT2_ARAAL|nr:hypothetical protein AALP_AA1G172100 [Arabis alpina]